MNAMPGLSWIVAAAALGFVAACGQDRAKPAPSDSTAAAPAAAGADTGAAASGGLSKVEGFEHPESARYDAELDVWYVSNINGSPLDKDGNGYISRLKADGTIDSLKFIEGGKNGVTLNGPKGLALQGDTLWVADIDAVRAFDRRTGRPVATVDLKGRAKFLNDVAVGPDGIYVTDTGLEGSKSGMSHPGPDQIFRIGPGHKASVAIKSDSLTGPNGIAWDGANHRFIVVPFGGPAILAWTPGSKSVESLGAGKGQFDGVEILDSARILVTSWADSSLFVLENGRAVPVAGDLPSPADIGVDTKRHRVAIPLLMENRVEFRALPATAIRVP
jgi:SMP-30/gluconolaconase/LRE-like protein